MFWNDPMLYGATLPYDRNVNINTLPQTPVLGPVFPGWQNTQKFLPPSFYGYNPYINVPPVIHPFMQTAGMLPFQQQFDRPAMGLNQPFHGQFDRPWGFDTPFYGQFRPFNTCY